MKKKTISAISFLAGTALGLGTMERFERKRCYKLEKESGKHLALFLMMNQWVKLKQENKSLVSYFMENEYKEIAVYGMSYAGETLVEELKGSEIEVVYGIDNRADSLYSDLNIVSSDDSLEKVDVVVVTAITFFDEIEEKLSKKINCPIISLEDILYNM